MERKNKLTLGIKLDREFDKIIKNFININGMSIDFNVCL